MAFETKEIVREYWAMGFSVQEALAVLNISLMDGGFTWDQVTDMYMQLQREEEAE